ncbi:TPR repeat-containing protein YfgC precursor [Anaplasma phagocytophilum]|nr:TPR repeat-containing protein YfgC precursor [Anaplasma phagocytophilum]SCV66333.1 TPR repeat-containing protein YfgC precursor [Anaplasma phagocytophilum]
MFLTIIVLQNQGVLVMKASVVLLCLMLVIPSVRCSGGIVFRDSEIENVIKKISKPLFVAANLNVDEVKVFVVDDNRVNAFVAPNNYVFIHKGLLKFSKDPEVVVGVIAHEIGHMAQYHLIKQEHELRNEMIAEGLGYILGMVTSLVLDPKIGHAIIAGSSTVSQRSFLAYSRTQEEIADQCALEYLDAAGYSHEGLLHVLRFFGQHEAQHLYLDEYMLTHPLSEQRLRKLYGYKKQREVVGFSEEDKASFERIVEKVEAFLMPLDTLKNRELSPYMQSIVDYREANVKEAIQRLNVLIDAAPTDPYLREIRAQILYKLGDVEACIADYKAALSQIPNDMLLKVELAQALVLKDPAQALPYLEQVMRVERDNPYVWKQLSLVYGRMGKVAMSYFALANMYFFEGDEKRFLEYVKLSKKYFDNNSFQLRIIQDLEDAYRAS